MIYFNHFITLKLEMAYINCCPENIIFPVLKCVDNYSVTYSLDTK